MMMGNVCIQSMGSQNLQFKLKFIKKSKMIDFLEIFQEKIYNQYFIIGVAVLIVIVLKIWMARKAYQKKLASFIHPDTVLGDLKQKVKTTEQAQTLLAFNIHKVTEDESRLRNIAFLMALLKQKGVPLRPLKQKIQETFSKLNKDTLSKTNKTYKQYILTEIQQDQKDKKNKKKKSTFYTS